jgi:hypothetical protein
LFVKDVDAEPWSIPTRHAVWSIMFLADASPEDWAKFVGVPHDTVKPVSFVLLADPRFNQVGC